MSVDKEPREADGNASPDQAQEVLNLIDTITEHSKQFPSNLCPRLKVAGCNSPNFKYFQSGNVIITKYMGEQFDRNGDFVLSRIREKAGDGTTTMFTIKSSFGGTLFMEKFIEAPINIEPTGPFSSDAASLATRALGFKSELAELSQAQEDEHELGLDRASYTDAKDLIDRLNELFNL